MARTMVDVCGLASLGVLVGATGCEPAPLEAPASRPTAAESVPEEPAPSAPLLIEVTGDDFNWYHRYPGTDGELRTEDDVVAIRNVHVPVNTKTTLELHSKDYVYTFALPHLGLKEIAVPDMTFSLEFEEDTPGTYELRGDQLCGYSHPDLIGKLVVETQQDFVSWLENLKQP